MEVNILRGSDAFSEIAAEWETLHHVSVTATPFNSLPYARLWWAHLGGGELELWTVRDGGELIGIAPFHRALSESGDPALYFMGGTDVSDYLDVITAPTRESEVADALINNLLAANCCFDLYN